MQSYKRLVSKLSLLKFYHFSWIKLPKKLIDGMQRVNTIKKIVGLKTTKNISNLIGVQLNLAVAQRMTRITCRALIGKTLDTIKLVIVCKVVVSEDILQTKKDLPVSN
jgi:hypothetical protein